MQNRINDYEKAGDVLEYGSITDEKAIELCNKIIKESLEENKDEVLESMYHAVLNGVTHRNIADKLDTSVIEKVLEKFSEEVSDYIITILAYTGKKENSEIIKRIGLKYKNLDIKTALYELNYRVCNIDTII